MKWMKPTIAMLPLALLYASSASVAASQAVPTSQPNLLTITREDVKTGHNAAHAAHEVGWPAAYAKAKSPYYYLAMVSMTGPNEAWYISSYASHATYGESMKMESDNATLSAELARLWSGRVATLPIQRRSAGGFAAPAVIGDCVRHETA